MNFIVLVKSFALWRKNTRFSFLSKLDEQYHEPVIESSRRIVEMFGYQIKTILQEEFSKCGIELKPITAVSLEKERSIEESVKQSDMWSTFKDLIESLKKKVFNLIYGEIESEPKKKELPDHKVENNTFFMAAKTIVAVAVSYVLYKSFSV
jgi:hypothetical protein